METSYYSTHTSFVIVFVTALFFILHVNSYKGKKITNISSSNHKVWFKEKTIPIVWNMPPYSWDIFKFK